MAPTSQRFGILGLGVMGRSLALNLATQDVPLAAYSYSSDERVGVRQLDSRIDVSDTLDDFVGSIERPRSILLMITAGDPVDQVLSQLRPLLAQGDVVIDGGNSRYQDTERRVAECAEGGVTFMGVGISGGEEGARYGASVMVGGSRSGFEQAERLFDTVACRVGNDPCYGWVGAGGAGHLVKTVHNGIEYGVMQLIAEVYDLKRRGHGRPLKDVQRWFDAQRSGVLASYLIDITAGILATPDDLGDGALIDKVADRAGQKGTGVWSVQAALEYGVPVPTIIAAVTERQLSGQARDALAERFGQPEPNESASGLEEDFADALHLAMIATFVQGLSLIAAASRVHDWGTDVASAVKLWRGGCIIRAALLDTLLEALTASPSDPTLLLAPGLAERVAQARPALRRVVASAHECGIATPALAASLAYIDSLTTERLPTHLVQAQRDCFGAHTFERTDRPGSFHADWL